MIEVGQMYKNKNLSNVVEIITVGRSEGNHFYGDNQYTDTAEFVEAIDVNTNEVFEMGVNSFKKEFKRCS